MGFGEAISSGLSKYATFSGRAPRSEYWYWTLFAIILSIIAAVIDAVVFPRMGLKPVGTIVSLGLLLPGIAVSVRRLHDLDRTGWWFLIAFTIIGLILLLIWDCMKGTTGPNRYGPDPIPGA
jgi:uncharacterized membrane protein YhaH (DUF805 family)